MSKLGFVEGRGAVIWQALLLFVCGIGLALPSAKAQRDVEPAAASPSALGAGHDTGHDSGNEAEALRAFMRGASAYEEANYEAALQAFEEAFRLGGQGEVQYDIALAAERAGQTEKALAAYRAYLELVEEPPLELEAQARIRALLFAGTEPDSSISVTYQPTDPYQPEDFRPKRKRAVVGPVVLMALGLGGVGVMTAGFIKAGKAKCVAEDQAGRCVEQEVVNTVPTAIYGSVGAAFLAGGAIWIGLSGRTNTVFGLGPGRIEVKGRF